MAANTAGEFNPPESIEGETGVLRLRSSFRGSDLDQAEYGGGPDPVVHVMGMPAVTETRVEDDRRLRLVASAVPYIGAGATTISPEGGFTPSKHPSVEVGYTVPDMSYPPAEEDQARYGRLIGYVAQQALFGLETLRGKH